MSNLAWVHSLQTWCTYVFPVKDHWDHFFKFSTSDWHGGLEFGKTWTEFIYNGFGLLLTPGSSWFINLWYYSNCIHKVNFCQMYHDCIAYKLGALMYFPLKIIDTIFSSSRHLNDTLDYNLVLACFWLLVQVDSSTSWPRVFNFFTFWLISLSKF